MSDLDQNIKDLFQKKVGEFEAPVDPSAWSAIQSGIGASAGSTAAAAGGIATWIKISVASLFAIAMAVVAVNVLTEDEPTTEAEKIETSQESQVQVAEPEIELTDIQEPASEGKPIAEANPSNTEKAQVEKGETIAEANEPINEDGQSNQDSPAVENSIPTNKPSQEASNANPNTGMMGSATGNSAAAGTTEYAPLKGTFSATQDAFDYLSYGFKADEEAHAYFWELDGKTFTEAAFDYEFEQSGEYEVELTVTDRIGKLSKQSMTVLVREKSELVVPNIFTPNGDDKNASFDVERASTGIVVVNILIFNMSGELVFEGNELRKSWDGMLPNGDRAPEGKYTVQLQVKESGGKEYNTSELITLRR